MFKRSETQNGKSEVGGERCELEVGRCVQQKNRFESCVCTGARFGCFTIRARKDDGPPFLFPFGLGEIIVTSVIWLYGLWIVSYTQDL